MITPKIKLSTLLIIAFIICIGFAAGFLFLNNQNNTKVVIIPKYYSVIQITDKLAQEKVLKYHKIFYPFFMLYALKYPFKSGEYIIHANAALIQILNILSSGKSVVHKLVIPKGITVNEIISKINAEERLFGSINEEISEGHLMPSTYFYTYGDQKIKIINQMQKLMAQNLDLLLQNLSSDSPLKTKEDLLILASIIEKETSLDEERPMIAAVFLNRLKNDMKLQADPTVIYGITGGKFKLARNLTRADLKTYSEYNTYIIKGLPKSAISCPGIKSLKAVINPSETSALYFVSDGTNKHNFANNLRSHYKNVIKYKEIMQKLNK